MINALLLPPSVLCHLPTLEAASLAPFRDSTSASWYYRRHAQLSTCNGQGPSRAEQVE